MEQVMVVDRGQLEALLPDDVFVAGEHVDHVVEFILNQHFFEDREKAEYDPTLKQVIPYIVLRKKGAFFVLRRLKGQTETRLHHKLSLGIGGHINPGEEQVGEESVLDAGMRRELAEEVFVEHIKSLDCIGIINENLGGVGDYHVGLVYLLEAEGRVEVLETEKMEGSWLSFESLEEKKEEFETWSAILLDQFFPTLPS